METAEKIEPKEVIYTAGPGDPVAVDWHGHRFVHGVPRMVENEHILGLVDGNPSFAFKGQDKAAELAAKRETEAKQAEAERTAMLEMEAKAMEERHARERGELEAKIRREEEAMDRRYAEAKPKAPAEPEPEPATLAPAVDTSSLDN